MFYLAADGVLMETAVEQPGLRVSTPVPLFQAGLDAANVFNVRNEYDVAPDGQSFLINAPVSPSRAGSLTVLLNGATLSR